MSNNMENMLMNMNDSDSDSDEDHHNHTTTTNAGAGAGAVNPPVVSQPPTVTTTSLVPVPNPMAVSHGPLKIEPIPIVQPMMVPPPTTATTTSTIPSNTSHYHSIHVGSQIPQQQQQSQQRQQQQQQQPRVPFEPSMLDIEPTPLRDIKAAQSKAIQPPVAPSSIHPVAAATASTTQMRNNANHPMHTHALHKPHISLPTQSHAQSLPTHHPTSSSSHVTSATSLSATDHKSRKEQFLMFTRVLMKYLDKQDPNMHTHAKQVIRECAQKNRNGDPGYSSLSISMQKRLKQLVGDVYWHKATEYLAKYFKDQYMKTGRMTEDQARRKAHEHARLAASDLSVDYSGSTPAMTTGVVTTGTTTASRYTPLSSSRMNVPTTSSTVSGLPTTTHDKQQQQPHNRVVPPPILTNIAKVPSSKRTTTPSTEKKKKTYTKKGSASNTPTSMTQASLTGGTTTSTTAANATANREYNILMEMVHHVVDYDVKSCGLILNHDSKVKGDLNLTEEQKQLVYGDFGIATSTPQEQRQQQRKVPFQKGLYSGPQSTMKSIPSYMKGWGSRNALSVRAAWAKLRLEEEERYALEQSSLVLPGVDLGDTIKDEATSNEKDPCEWFNEEEAEEDDTLALISEATQYYLRTILQGAMHAASQRLNLDGIRLWHAQHHAADKGANQESIPFSLRLGCDVQRQVALTQGNAAKTCQRMEEALSRSSGSKGDIDYNVLCNTSNMMELSKIPVISSAVAKAEESAKRSFEIYGGKYSGEPPFGRVPKKAKIMVKDLNVCLSNTAFAVKKKGFLYRLH